MNDDFERSIDKIIREAREKGAFDNLPGKGKPIQWEDESSVPDDMRMTNRMLKNAGFTLDWIELGRELDGLYDAARQKLKLARRAHTEGRLNRAGWQAAAQEFVTQVKALNRRVIGYNLRVPSDHLQRRPYPIDPDFKGEND